ncbi:hypothetical protein ACYCFL_05545 [Stutzerimonas nitrititolerans]|uniref:hypothetical protein n=1 Tax=Stutzerimonas nitrititolerans TaxID=2482751 RepID=UPI00289AA87E|nr:hypothetical protein [Stutzerimonas nitrititolerans]
MTTTVYDKAKLRVACDSRWSIPGDFGVIFVDEAPFYKVGVYGKYAFLFAGRAPVISDWKRYLALSEAGVSVGQPSLEGIAVLVAELDSGALVDSYMQDIMWPSTEEPQSVFAGTGSLHAANCWYINRSADRAIETAKGFDLCTGGPIRYVELSSGERNWRDCQGLDCLNNAFLEKGMVMLNRADRNNSVIPFAQAAEMDPSVAELYNKAASGALGSEVQAPCDAIFNHAPHDEQKRFAKALHELLSQ